MQIFGELERLLSEVLYPYRVPLTAGMVLLIAAAGAWAWRGGQITRLLTKARGRPALSVLVALATLAVLVPVGNYLVTPLWTRNSVTEISPLDAKAVPPASLTNPFQARVVSRGEWNGADEFHFARGRVLVVEVAPGQHVLRMEDFAVRNGPDLYVMLSPAADGYRDGAIQLGRLKATDGAFNYEIPPGTNLDGFRSAVIWCQQFAVLFGTATFTKA